MSAKNDFLSNGDLPTGIITVRLAAMILAVEQGEWDGKQYQDAELEPFISEIADIGGKPERALRSAHTWGKVVPTGSILQACNAIESLLCRSIDAGRLATLSELRDLTDALIPTETLLSVYELPDWAEEHCLFVEDYFSDYVQGEVDLAISALSRVNAERARLEDPDAHGRAVDRAASIKDEEIIELLHENGRMRDLLTRHPPRPLDARERTTLLCIIGALAMTAKLDLSKPMKSGEVISAMLPADVKLSPRTVGEHLKKVAEAMDARRM